MVRSKLNFNSWRKPYYLIVGLLLIGNGLGVFLILNDDSIRDLPISSCDKSSQKGKNALVSSKNTFVRDNFNGHRYELIQDTRTWSDAKIDCESRGGYLVTITSQEENDFITNLIGSNHVWIGFTDETTEGDWQWVTGEPVTYTNWGGGQPDDWDVGEDYAELGDSEYWSGIHWNDCPTGMGNYYVCEFENQEPSGNFNGHQYTLITLAQTWTHAKIGCEARGGHLVTINSQEENELVRNLIGSNIIWIGFTDEVTEGDWQWVTGEPITYTNWVGPPDDSGMGEDYAEMLNDGLWNDIGGPQNPHLVHNYVCEFENQEINYIEHDPIVIEGNEQFIDRATNEDWPGDGSRSTPYLIENLEIIGNGGLETCIEIWDTNLYFQISNCILSEGFEIISLHNVENGEINHNVIKNMVGGNNPERTGIVLFGGSSNKILNNTVYNCEWAISVEDYSQGNFLVNNTLYDCNSGISLN
ncbi:MAG: lectin-like protein [Candidatus Hodarchaeales archaeon]|jgi:hypothetical protein